MLNPHLQINYNSEFDVLYIRLGDMANSYGHEENYGIILNYNRDTQELVGIDIWDFKTRFQHNNNIELPVAIDLKNIYDSLPN